MNRILKKYTTIPQELYVQRKADIQLERIISEMQRPGYVLVARQMGKTNLLLNAKRTLANEQRVFAYIDLSNLFEKERDCYRNIIDYIIEPNYEIFSKIESKIDELRRLALPPHKEYSRCLKVILDCFKGDLVVILDEIDALKSIKYSDNIFAQIRTTYFQLRTNSDDFNRLTYVLSGVIEPADLIKDKNKSPFNIGEKIYLDDFSKSEHNGFIQKSKLDISIEVSDEIFNWTKGNPRLTFDICSEIENKIIFNNVGIEISDVEEIIKEKYLTLFDLPPIDHIRQLVAQNRPIRKAIKEIQQGKQDCSDEIKTKLYLYGIISSDFTNPIKIKNKVISESLSLSWIESVNKQTKDAFSYGIEKIEEGYYKEGILILTEFLSNSTSSKQQLEISNYHIGFCHFQLKEYKKASQSFSNDFTIGDYPIDAEYFLARCSIQTGGEKKGVENLERIIKNNKSSAHTVRNSLLTLGTYYFDKNQEHSIKLFNELILSCEESEEKENDSASFRTYAFYFKALIYFNQGDKTKAYNELLEAKKTASESEIPKILYWEFLTNKENKEPLKELVDIIINKNIKINDNETKDLDFSYDSLNVYLYSTFLNDRDNYSRLVSYAIETIFSNTKNELEILFEITQIPLTNSERKVILKEIISRKDDIQDNHFLYKVYRDLSYASLHSEKEFIEIFNKYFKLFSFNNGEITIEDISLFAQKARTENTLGNFNQGIKVLNVIEQYLPNLDEEEINEGLIIYFWLAALYFGKKDNKEATFYARKTLEIVEGQNTERTSIIDEKGLKIVSEQMHQIIHSSRVRVPIKSSKKYGRNDKVEVKYENGLIKKGKYKLFEADVISHRCIVIREIPKQPFKKMT